MLEIILINFNRVDLVFECLMLVFEWEGFGLKFFWKNTSLYVCVWKWRQNSIYMHVRVYMKMKAKLYLYVCARVYESGGKTLSSSLFFSISYSYFFFLEEKCHNPSCIHASDITNTILTSISSSLLRTWGNTPDQILNKLSSSLSLTLNDNKGWVYNYL